MNEVSARLGTLKFLLFKNKKMKKQTGIWLDLRNAWIFTLPNDDEHMTEIVHIRSEIDESSTNFGGQGATTWQQHGGAGQSSAEERRHHAEKHYFGRIFSQLDPATKEAVIFGPSEAKNGLNNYFKNQRNGPEIMGVEPADQMTTHQMTAWVRKFFGRTVARKKPDFGQIHE